VRAAADDDVDNADSDNANNDELPWSSQSAFLSALPAWGLDPVPALAVSELPSELLAAHAELAAGRGSLGRVGTFHKLTRVRGRLER
jgi:hypothetical protein